MSCFLLSHSSLLPSDLGQDSQAGGGTVSLGLLPASSHPRGHVPHLASLLLSSLSTLFPSPHCPAHVWGLEAPSSLCTYLNICSPLPSFPPRRVHYPGPEIVALKGVQFPATTWRFTTVTPVPEELMLTLASLVNPYGAVTYTPSQKTY